MHTIRAPIELIRFRSLDSVKGLLLLIVSGTHAYLMSTGVSGDETWFNTQFTNNDPFFSLVRFIGHPVATGFAACMGIGMVLLRHNKLQQRWSEAQVCGFFLKRGLVLLLLQFTLANTAWRLGGGSLAWSDLSFVSMFSLVREHYYFGVLFMLGSCMMLGSAFLKTRSFVLLFVGTAIVISPAFYLVEADTPADFSALLGPLAVPGGWSGMWVLYSIIPFLGIVLIGMFLGHLILHDQKRFLFSSWKIGSALLLSTVCWFVAKLALSEDGGAAFQIIRYPPELMLVIYAIGLLMTLLWLFDQPAMQRLGSILSLFGRSTLFFYLVHLFLYAGFASFFDRSVTTLQTVWIFFCGTCLMALSCWLYLNARRSAQLFFNKSLGEIEKC